MASKKDGERLKKYTGADENEEKNASKSLRSLVYTYFYKTNKPVNRAEVVLQFKDFKRKEVENVLDALVNKGMIQMKASGKLKYYCLFQNTEYTIDDLNYTDEIDAAQDQSTEDKVLRFLKWKSNGVAEQLKSLMRRVAELDKEIASRKGQLSNEELVSEIYRMEKLMDENRGDFKSVEIVSEEAMETRKVELLRLNKEVQARRKLFRKVVDSLCECLNLKRRELLDEAGIEN